MTIKEKIYNIKIPENIDVFYYEKKNIVIIKGPFSQKVLKTKIKIDVLSNLKQISVKSKDFFKLSNSKKKQTNSLQGTIVSLIKQLLLETSYTFYKKLKLIGVGYRIFNVEKFKEKLLFLKLGFSHFIYFKIPLKTKVFCLKNTKLFIYGNFYQNLTEYAACIRSYKKPEPYKGKGILYDSEKIILKKGKKI